MDLVRAGSLVAVAALLVGAAPPPAHRVHASARSTIRMPLARARRPLPPPVPMIEKRGPRCIEAGTIAGAAVTAPDAVDFVLRGGERMRARLDGECPSLGFYGGFYMDPGDDARICSGRDVIRTRAGGECAIERFRRLVPPRPPKP